MRACSLCIGAAGLAAFGYFFPDMAGLPVHFMYRAALDLLWKKAGKSRWGQADCREKEMEFKKMESVGQSSRGFPDGKCDSACEGQFEGDCH